MFDNQRLIKIAHNRVICDQETGWLKKIDSQTTICKIFYPIKNEVRRMPSPQIPEDQKRHGAAGKTAHGRRKMSNGHARFIKKK
ncbi:MAG: hypothetical protein MRZ70_04475 [Prevotella sp.]|nr:hypothetical protein [Prevotella sp.]